MNKRTPLTVVFTTLALSSCVLARSAEQVSIDTKQIESAADTAAKAQLAAGLTPGLTIAVAKDGQTLFSRAYGIANPQANSPATPDTAYNVGSITKQFTAALVLRLAESGKLSLDDPITKHLPDFPAQHPTITLRHLLNHTSGIKSFDLSEDGGRFFATPPSYQRILDRFAQQPLDFPPGTKHQYNNTAYCLLGQVIARATGSSYAQALQQELLTPLHLAHTSYCHDHAIAPNHAAGHDRAGDTLAPARPVDLRGVDAAGALCSTAGDLLLWTQLLHSGKVLSPASLKEMTAPTTLADGQTVDYGFGLFLGTLDGHRKIYHGGRGAGFLTLVTHYPDDHLTVAVLTNSSADRDARDQIERAVARAALGITALDLPLTAADLARYAGTYDVRSGARSLPLRVSTDDGHLIAQLGTSPITRLRHQGNHAFLHGENDDIRLTFTPAANDARAHVTIQSGPRTLSGPRQD